MTEKIKVDIKCQIELEITPELKELLDRSKEDVYEVDDEIYNYFRKELYKKGVVEIDQLYNWIY